jgi:hypothetical protein
LTPSALDADLFDRLDEGHGAAVHDRHFGALHFDQKIVEAKRIDRRHHMLDRRDERAGEKPRIVQRSVLPTCEETARSSVIACS